MAVNRALAKSARLWRISFPALVLLLGCGGKRSVGSGPSPEQRTFFSSGDIFLHVTGLQNGPRIRLALQHLIPGTFLEGAFVPLSSYSVAIDEQQGSVHLVWQPTASNMPPPSWRDLPICYPALDETCVCPSDPIYEGNCFFE